MTKEEIRKQILADVAVREVTSLLDRLENGEADGAEYAISNAMATIAVHVTDTFGHSHNFSQVISRAKERYAESPTPTAKTF
jgi:hypothetical protein